jgi:tRNA 2-thiouridine synthesizing protein A
MDTEECDLVLDLTGLNCPYSLLELNGAFKDLRPGSAAGILADRPSAVDEVRAWCRATGNELVSVDAEAADGSENGKPAAPPAVRLVVRKA